MIYNFYLLFKYGHSLREIIMLAYFARKFIDARSRNCGTSRRRYKSRDDTTQHRNAGDKNICYIQKITNPKSKILIYVYASETSAELEQASAASADQECHRYMFEK